MNTTITMIATTKADQGSYNAAKTEYTKWCDENYHITAKETPWLFNTWFRQQRKYYALERINNLKYTEIEYNYNWVMISGIKDIENTCEAMPLHVFKRLSYAVDWLAPGLSDVSEFSAYFKNGVICVEVKQYDGKKDVYFMRLMSQNGVAAFRDKADGKHTQLTFQALRADWFREIEEYEIF